MRSHPLHVPSRAEGSCPPRAVLTRLASSPRPPAFVRPTLAQLSKPLFPPHRLHSIGLLSPAGSRRSGRRRASTRWTVARTAARSRRRSVVRLTRCSSLFPRFALGFACAPVEGREGGKSRWTGAIRGRWRQDLASEERCCAAGTCDFGTWTPHSTLRLFIVHLGVYGRIFRRASRDTRRTVEDRGVDPLPPPPRRPDPKSFVRGPSQGRGEEGMPFSFHASSLRSGPS